MINGANQLDEKSGEGFFADIDTNISSGNDLYQQMSTIWTHNLGTLTGSLMKLGKSTK